MNNNLMKKYPLAIFCVCIWMVFFTVVSLSACSEEKNGDIRVENTEIRSIGKVMAELRQIRDTAVYGKFKGMYPEESKDILNKAIKQLADLILSLHQGEVVPTETKDNSIANAYEAMKTFKATVRTEDEKAPAAELFVDGIDGNGYINFGVQPAYSSFGEADNQQFTVELWFKQAKPTNFGCILSTFYENSENRFGWMMNTWNGHLRMSYSLTSRGLIEPAKAYKVLNKWIHLAAVYNDKGVDGEMENGKPVFLKFYLNGEEVSRMVKPDGRSYVSNPLDNCPMIGFAGVTSDGKLFRRLSGYMKDIHIWNKTKTPTEIADIMNKKITVSGSEPDLVCGWSFDAEPRDSKKIIDLTNRYYASVEGSYEWREIKE